MTEITPKVKRIEYLDIFRAFGIIFMIMGHIEFGSMFSRFIHGFHMPMFFFVSGMLYCAKYRREDLKVGRDVTFLKFVSNKAKSLLIPYAFFGILQYGLWLSGLGGIQDIQFTRPFEFLTHFLWDNNNGMAYAGALWFLTALFVTEVIYAAIDLKITSKWKYAIFFAIGIFGNLFKTFFSFDLPFSISAGFSGVSLFALGDLFENYKEKNKIISKISELPIILTLLLGAVSGAVIMLNKNGVNMRSGTYGNIFLYYIGAVTAIIAGINLSKTLLKIFNSAKIFNYPKKWLEGVGRNSIVYLCLNQVVIVNLTDLFSFVSNLYLRKIIILISTFILLFAIDALIRNSGFDFMLGKFRKNTQKAENFFKRQIPAAVCYLLICALLIGSFIFQYRDNHIDLSSIKVASPQISTQQLKTSNPTYSEKDLLLSCIRNNLSTLENRKVYETTMSYAYSSSSAISEAKSLTNAQKQQIEQYLDLSESGEKLILPNIKSNYENTLRPWAHQCYSQASAIYFGLIDDDKIEGTTELVKQIIDCMSANHCINTRSGWGKKRQSALWVENIGFAAWLMWDKLSEEVQENVLRMVIVEADRFIDCEVPYYRDKNGTIIYPGDTKGEENAWNSRLLSLAACMMPEHKHSTLWAEKATVFLLSSSSVPSDLNNPEYAAKLNGSNFNEDGTVINHSKVHIDYASCIMEGMVDTYLIYTLAGKEVPQETLHNFDIIYSAFVNLDLSKYNESKSGSHFYERNKETDTPSGVVNMPQENDWGGNWYASYFLNDIIVERFDMDTACPDGLKASDWANVHLKTINAMINRTGSQHINGQFFVEGENNFVSGEAYQTHCLIKAYMISELAFLN